jgi:hypothetical protein
MNTGVGFALWPRPRRAGYGYPWSTVVKDTTSGVASAGKVIDAP